MLRLYKAYLIAVTARERRWGLTSGRRRWRCRTGRRGTANRRMCTRAYTDMSGGCMHFSERRNSVFCGDCRLTAASGASLIFHPRLVCGIAELWLPLRGEWGLPHLRAQNQHPYGAPEKLPSVPVLMPRLRPGVRTPTERSQLTK